MVILTLPSTYQRYAASSDARLSGLDRRYPQTAARTAALSLHETPRDKENDPTQIANSGLEWKTPVQV
jgi:hypothetical protein